MGKVPGSRLLIVDDEADLREVFREILENTADEIDVAVNGEEALEMAQSRKFDAVVSDINMPVMTGLQFLENLRQMGVHTPVIFTTAYGDTANTTKAHSLGAFSFLEKPVRNDIFRSTVEQALQVGLLFRNFEVELTKRVADLGDDDPEKIAAFKEQQREEFLAKVQSRSV